MPNYYLPPAEASWNSVVEVSYAINISLLPSPFERSLGLDLDLPVIRSEQKLRMELKSFGISDAFDPDFELFDPGRIAVPIYSVWHD